MADSVVPQTTAIAVAQSDLRPLVAKQVSKRFGGLQALQAVDLTLQHGERRALLGPNGAGKTTLFHLISGTFAPTSGSIMLFGQDVTRMPVHKRARLGMARTFQITNLLPTLSVLENTIMALQASAPCRFVLHRRVSSYDHLFSQARKILEEWDLWARRDVEVRSLSYGEQREIEIIMALAQRPRLLLLDEPTSGLSAAETARVTQMIQDLPRDVTVVLIEHDMDVAFDIVDNMSVLYQGTIIAEGKPEEIRRDHTVQQIYFGSQFA